MKKFVFIIFFSLSIKLFSCGGGDYYHGDSFYNLFKQTNVSAEEFYPFLKDNYNAFYGDDFYYKDKKTSFGKGNIKLWKEILNDWNDSEIKKAVYSFKDFDWSNKSSKISKRSKIYLAFANKCSEAFKHRENSYYWNYEKIQNNKQVDTESLITQAQNLLKEEKNKQLKARYYYQLIRILHYSKSWSEAVSFFENNIENKLMKDEIYYYITDQVAGCYYSVGKYNKAAYLFLKVVNKSIDRKKSAFVSYNFCTQKGGEGKSFFQNIEDQKDHVFIKNLRSFSDEIGGVYDLMSMDSNDSRVELLFMRALNSVEGNIWIKNYGFRKDETLPYKKNQTNYKELIKISTQQMNNSDVENTDFWKLANSYLLFIDGDLISANQKLTEVSSYLEQKEALKYIYEVFSWATITKEKEQIITEVLKKFPINTESWTADFNTDIHRIILDQIAHVYYKNGRIAESFLVHNNLENAKDMGSIQLLNALGDFYSAGNHSNFQKKLLNKKYKNHDFLKVVNYYKGVYYIHNQQPKTALRFLEKAEDNLLVNSTLSNQIFSNNTRECFTCPEESVMEDEVFKASVFSYIKNEFNAKEAAEYLVELEKQTQDEKKWIRKLSNYLLGNFYFNISNTGYYRGVLTNRYRAHYYFFPYSDVAGNEVIKERKGFNLENISRYSRNYYNLSSAVKKYYQKVIQLSADKELNARCYFLMAKCELNDFYNYNSSLPIVKYKINSSYNFTYNLTLPKSIAFQKLKENYSDTEFHKKIINQCSYFRLYSANF